MPGKRNMLSPYRSKRMEQQGMLTRGSLAIARRRRLEHLDVLPIHVEGISALTTLGYLILRAPEHAMCSNFLSTVVDWNVSLRINIDLREAMRNDHPEVNPYFNKSVRSTLDEILLGLVDPLNARFPKIRTKDNVSYRARTNPENLCHKCCLYVKQLEATLSSSSTVCSRDISKQGFRNQMNWLDPVIGVFSRLFVINQPFDEPTSFLDMVVINRDQGGLTYIITLVLPLAADFYSSWFIETET
ncbi:hypothetical protein BX616_009849 [Lobosporangium transversale]|uniref:Uncharacterized protein n=1 Tax=Lobosporangium transversale TaxID=64571 RepID=A0A1Y2GDY0_9FUNG|nr:hypothetical protein BCR41DRAFT_373451 [Lobosporangium transversale]KAF9913588.1 hypothetical protein BX616_009849 [Lobosporangium transversale]ORZ08061.1 hypothetical protein BCR41DRAFT_373451 [Lobosporangium transversale]|eukprot:XP_021878295.1 hypothetical protein BCR41DRAFT_373451 [Lobosporangium transversale]